jgi:TPR repeat protein
MSDYLKRLLALIEAAENGDCDAMLDFISITSLHPELSRDPVIAERAEDYLNILVNKGNSAGFILAGDRYRTGDGVEKNVERAVANFYLAANTGETFGYELIAQMHIEGDGLPINYDIAYEYLKKSEEANDGELRSDCGNFFMGEVYYFGLSVPQNWQKAKEYYLKVIDRYGAGDFYWRACNRIAIISETSDNYL